MASRVTLPASSHLSAVRRPPRSLLSPRWPRSVRNRPGSPAPAPPFANKRSQYLHLPMRASPCQDPWWLFRPGRCARDHRQEKCRQTAKFRGEGRGRASRRQQDRFQGGGPAKREEWRRQSALVGWPADRGPHGGGRSCGDGRDDSDRRPDAAKTGVPRRRLSGDGGGGGRGALLQMTLGARQATLLAAARVGPLLRRKGPENAVGADICMWQRQPAAYGLQPAARCDRGCGRSCDSLRSPAKLPC